MQNSLIPNTSANQMRVEIASVPDCVFMPTGWVCSLISRFNEVASTLRRVSHDDSLKSWRAFLTCTTWPLKHDLGGRILSYTHFHQLTGSLTLIRLGGHDGPPPSTYRTITRQRAKLSPRHFMTIFFRVSRTFWHQICDGRGYGSEVT